MSLEELQGLITEQEKLSIRAETEWEDSPLVREFGGCLRDSLSGRQSHEHGEHGTRIWSGCLLIDTCFKAALGTFFWCRILFNQQQFGTLNAIGL